MVAMYLLLGVAQIQQDKLDTRERLCTMWKNQRNCPICVTGNNKADCVLPRRRRLSHIPMDCVAGATSVTPFSSVAPVPTARLGFRSFLNFDIEI